MMGKRNRVESLSICPMVIITSSSYWRKTGISVHVDSRVAVTNFKMDPRHSITSCAIKEVLKQLTAHPFAVETWQHGNQQKLGFVCNGPE